MLTLISVFFLSAFTWSKLSAILTISSITIYYELQLLLTQNWKEMEFALMRLIMLAILIGADVGIAVHQRQTEEEGKGSTVSHIAHIGGFVIGLLLGSLAT